MATAVCAVSHTGVCRRHRVGSPAGLLPRNDAAFTNVAPTSCKSSGERDNDDVPGYGGDRRSSHDSYRLSKDVTHCRGVASDPDNPLCSKRMMSEVRTAFVLCIASCAPCS